MVVGVGVSVGDDDDVRASDVATIGVPFNEVDVVIVGDVSESGLKILQGTGR